MPRKIKNNISSKKNKPGVISRQLTLARHHIETGHLSVAEELIGSTMDSHPHNAEAFSLLGTVHAQQGNKSGAICCYRKALRVAPDNLNYLVKLGILLLTVFKPEQAMDCCKRILKIRPDNIEALILEARILMMQGETETAYQRICSLLESTQDNLSTVLAFADISGHAEHREEAIALLKTFLEHPNYKGNDAQSHIHFSLGKLYDGIEKYDLAFHHYRKGNDIVPVTFNPSQYRARTNGLIDFTSADFLARAPRSALRTELPVFVVGMARSGTSLVEQILASHSKIFGGGELQFFDEMATELFKAGGDRYLSKLMPKEMDAFAHQYIDRLAALNESADRIVDKMPGNFIYLGLIELLIPGARIIHCVRDARDTCLSGYFQYFAEQKPYAYNLDNLGTYYNGYRKIMEHWRNVLKVPILEIHYEDLVENFESCARSLIGFCGMEWEDQCLRFYEAKRFVGTASTNQVRRPLYKSSVQRWKNYEAHIGALLESLDRPF